MPNRLSPSPDYYLFQLAAHVTVAASTKHRVRRITIKRNRLNGHRSEPTTIRPTSQELYPTVSGELAVYSTERLYNRHRVGFFLTSCSYAFPNLPQVHSLPLGWVSGGVQCPAPSSQVQSSHGPLGLAQTCDQPPYVEHGQASLGPNWGSVHEWPSQSSLFFDTGTQASIFPPGSALDPSGQVDASRDFQAAPSFSTPTSVPSVAVQVLNSGVTQQVLTIDVGAVVMQRDDGLFFCSELGCDAAYPRIGDCRRHLKKHNGPFFHCEQHRYSMRFYRHDKLRAHMQQAHGITIPPPGSRRRQRRSAAGQ